jgi:hypothetical protein
VKPVREMVKMHIKFQEWESYDVNNFGRGSSDLAATTIGRDLGSKEIQVCSLILYKLPIESLVAPESYK